MNNNTQSSLIHHLFLKNIKTIIYETTSNSLKTIGHTFTLIQFICKVNDNAISFPLLYLTKFNLIRMDFY